MKAIWNDEVYDVVDTTAKTAKLNVSGKIKSVPLDKIRIIDEKTATIDDLEKALDEYEGEKIDDTFDPDFDQSEALRLNIGQKITAKFLGLSKYDYDGKEITQVLFRRPENGYTYHLSSYHPVNWFTKNGTIGAYYRITRLRDVETSKQPMKSYRYTEISDEKLVAALDNRMKEAIRNFNPEENPF